MARGRASSSPVFVAITGVFCKQGAADNAGSRGLICLGAATAARLCLAAENGS